MGFERLHKQGRETFASLVPGGQARLDEIFRVAPGLAEVAVGTVYGHLHHRRALDPRLREAAALAAIIASGMHGTPLAVHLRTGLAAGLAPAEILEVILEAAAFSGFPRAVAALPVVEEVFQKAALPIPPQRSPREVVLAVIDEVRRGPASESEGGLPSELWSVCRDPDLEVSVHTIAPRQVLAVVSAQGVPEAVLHVLVEDDRIDKVTWLTRRPAREPDPE